MFHTVSQVTYCMCVVIAVLCQLCCECIEHTIEPQLFRLTRESERKRECETQVSKNSLRVGVQPNFIDAG